MADPLNEVQQTIVRVDYICILLRFNF